MLTLTLNKKWYDMILLGKKKEEYREIKPYYTSRFEKLWHNSNKGYNDMRLIRFRNGYRSDSPSFVAIVTLDVGEGKPEWGANLGKEYYRLHILECREDEK